MPRWQYDEDADRLPEGFKRVGYDADTQRYTFQSGGMLYQGPEGAEFGEMTPIGPAPPPSAAVDEGEGFEHERSGRRDGYSRLLGSGMDENNRQAMRYMSPFYLLIGVVLLAGFWLFRIYLSPTPLQCPERTEVHTIAPGDTCYDIAIARGTTVERLLEINSGLECQRLGIGKGICVPLPVKEHAKDEREVS